MSVQGSDANATPHFGPRTGPPTPVVISNKILFEETVPAVPHFVGRAAELAAYHARLEREQFVIITGLAGMGKTTLGARLARDLAASFDQIFWFTFDLVEKYTADALYWSLASFLDSRGEPSLAKYLRGEIDAQQPLERAARLNLLIAALATGRYVLCFDDFQIVKEVPDIAYIFTVLRQRFVELRQPLPAHFIIIGREVPADLEYLADQTLSGLNSADTFTLLADRGVILPNELALQLWQRTGGNPKLLELTIGSLAGLSESDAAAFIASLDQQSNIRDYLLNNVYATLTREEQLVIGALSVFPGPIERAGLEEVLGEENIGSLTRRLDTLIHKHVLTATTDDYLDCHDLVRAYCYHALNRRERERFHQRAALYFEGEQNWLAAAHHQFERRDVARALELLVTHADAIINSGGAAALSQQLSLFTTPALTAEQRQLLHKTQANAFSIRGDYQAALAAYHTALDEAVSEGQQAELLWLTARAYLKMGDYQSTLDYGSRSLQLSEKSIDDHLGVARAHHDLGWAHYRLGYLPQAAQHFKLAEQIAQDAGETLLAAQASMALGVIAWKENRLEEAQKRLETSRRIFREQGSRTEEANAVGNLGLIYQALGDTRREIAHFLQAIDIYDQIGNVHGSLQALGNLGYLYLRQSKWPEAARYYDRLLHLAQDSGQRPMLSVAYCGLADCALAQAETRHALDLAIKAREIADEAGTSWELGLTSRVLGDVWLALNDANQAKRYFEESIPILEQHQEAEELARAKKGYQAALAQLGFNSIH